MPKTVNPGHSLTVSQGCDYWWDTDVPICCNDVGQSPIVRSFAALRARGLLTSSLACRVMNGSTNFIYYVRYRMCLVKPSAVKRFPYGMYL
ncbi:hypothetical protein J6590_001885 [Homalodisca vitripennis]|nr:hypothetical protein J6590_001885 [Homalodisca vitripennis]